MDVLVRDRHRATSKLSLRQAFRSVVSLLVLSAALLTLQLSLARAAEIAFEVEVISQNNNFSSPLSLRIAVVNSAAGKLIPASSHVIVSDSFDALFDTPGRVCCHELRMRATITRHSNFLRDGVWPAGRGEVTGTLPGRGDMKHGFANQIPEALLLELRTPDRKVVLHEEKFALRTDMFAHTVQPSKEFPFRRVNVLLLGLAGHGRRSFGDALLSSLRPDQLSAVSLRNPEARMIDADGSSSSRATTATATVMRAEARIGTEGTPEAFSISLWDTQRGLDAMSLDSPPLQEQLQRFLSGAVPDHSTPEAATTALPAASEESQQSDSSLWSSLLAPLPEPAPQRCAAHKDAAHVVVFAVRYDAVNCKDGKNDEACQLALLPLTRALDAIRSLRGDTPLAALVAVTHLDLLLSSDTTTGASSDSARDKQREANEKRRKTALQAVSTALNVPPSHVFAASSYRTAREPRDFASDLCAFRVLRAAVDKAERFAEQACAPFAQEDAAAAAAHEQRAAEAAQRVLMARLRFAALLLTTVVIGGLLMRRLLK